MNGFVKTLFAGLAVSAGLAAVMPGARAADMVEPVPEVVVAPPAVGGWYLRGDVGYSWSKFRRADYGVIGYECDECGNLNPVIGSNSLDGDLKGSFLIGGGIGYQVTDYFRTDLTVDYLTRSKIEGSTAGTCTGDGAELACTSYDRAKYSALSILANAYVDLGNFGGVTPYVGAGIGGTRIKWGDLSNTIPDGFDQSGTETHDGAASWRFTYALMAGVSVDLTESLKLDAGYRYRHVNGGKMFHGNGTWLGDGYDKGMNIHDVRLGLRYMFGGSSYGGYAPQQVSTIVDGPVYK